MIIKVAPFQKWSPYRSHKCFHSSVPPHVSVHVDLLAKLLPHSTHLKGLSPVCPNVRVQVVFHSKILLEYSH